MGFNMREQYMKRLLVYSVVFTALVMGAMLYFLSVKSVVIADELPAAGPVTGEADQELLFSRTNEGGTYLNIPISPEVRPDDITIENRMIDQCINIFIIGEKPDFYRDNPLTGNVTQVLEGHYGHEEDVVKIRLNLNGIYETDYVFNNSMLKIKFVPPGQLYDRIVILDTGDEESITSPSAKELVDSITLDVINRVKEKLKADNIKVYCTRTDEATPSLDKRVKLVNQADADIAVGIFVSSAPEDSGKCGTEAIYNGDYFIPGLSSVELADILEREVTGSIMGIANGLSETGEEPSMVREAKVAAAQIRLGYITNEKEASLLLREDYREKAADGIYRGICKAFEKKETEK